MNVIMYLQLKGRGFWGSLILEELIIGILQYSACYFKSTILFYYSPGMPEMLSPSAALVGAGLGKSVALVTDGRFSGASHGGYS